MLDLPGLPVLDKARLVGGCLRLPLTIDAPRLRQEVESLPFALWQGTGGRVGVYQVAQAIFLRGYAPAEGPKPIEERPPLALLPYAKSIILDLIGGSPLRCLLAQLPPDAVVDPHIANAPYFSKSLRVHVPVIITAHAWMYCAGLSQR